METVQTGQEQPRTPFESAYRAYRRLVNELIEHGASRSVAQALADATLRRTDEQQLKIEAHYYEIDRAFEQATPLWRALRLVRDRLDGGRHAHLPLPDVYAAALSMRAGGDCNVDRERSIYRGQRDARWKVVPSLFRREHDGSVPDIEARWRRTSAFAAAVRLAHPKLTAEQCVAVAQHYSGSEGAGSPTSLIDVTWEPLVALFFASLGGRSGDVGIVDHIVVPEWQRLVADEGDPGAIRVIEVPEVERIARQRALFLDVPDPELYERYLPHRVWFRQIDGLVFEDPDLEPPISREFAFPVDSSIQAIIEQLRSDRRSASDAAVVPRTPLLDEHTLHRRALEMEPRLAELDDHHASVLRVVCRLFARHAEWVSDPVPSRYSLQRIEECAWLIEQADANRGRCSVQDALQFTLSRLDEGESNRLLALAHGEWAALHAVPAAVVAQELARFVR